MSYTASTYHAKPKDVTRTWHVINAEGLVVGRVAAQIAKILRGKHKAQYTPHIDCGDHVIVINAEKMQFTGKKSDDRIFYWHTGYPGGIKQRSMRQILEGKYPERVLKKAIERMMPKESPLARQQLLHLHVYAGTEHPHSAQTPKALDLVVQNRKNKV